MRLDERRAGGHSADERRVEERGAAEYRTVEHAAVWQKRLQEDQEDAVKILITDRIAEEGIQNLRDAGFDVDVKLAMAPAELLAAVPAYDALIVRSATKVTKEVINAADKLKIIGRAGISVDNIDLDAATSRGVIVCNAPTSNIISAAEHALALMLAAARRIPQANASMHEGKWEYTKFVGNELYGKTLAIFGLGRVGALVAERARAFGMKIIGHDPYCSPDRAAHLGVTLYTDIEDMLPRADFITVHLPRTVETIGMFGPEEFAKMKNGVYLVNNARGGIYDVKALGDFIAAGKIAGVGVDVFEKEPCTDSSLLEFDQAILTPHISAATREAQDRAGIQIAEYVVEGLHGRIVPTAVNFAPVSPEVMDVIGPYIVACRMVGAIVSQLAREAISSLEMSIYGRLSAYDVRVLGSAVLSSLLSEGSDEPVNLVNADFLAEQRGLHLHIEKDPQCLDYTSSVEFVAHSSSQEIEIGCTLFGTQSVCRITSLFGRKFDFVPGENLVVFEYEDVPGKLGAVGTVLGNNDVNIATMEIGHNEGEETAIALLNVDQPLPATVKAEMTEVAQLRHNWYIRL